MPVNLPTAKDVRDARARATKALNENLEPVRAPFLAWVGANDWAASAVRGALQRARTRAEAVQGQLPRDLDELRGQLRREELGKLAQSYRSAARDTYQDLVRRGEATVERLRSRPPVKRVLDRLDEVSDQVEGRVEEMVEDFRKRGTDALGRLGRTTRSAGEQTARTTQRLGNRAAEAVSDAGEDVAEAVTEAGEDVARATRGTTRKAANRVTPAKPATHRSAPKRPAGDTGAHRAGHTGTHEG